MAEGQCSCCEQRFVWDEGAPAPVNKVTLLSAQLVPDKWPTSIGLCRTCAAGLPFDVSAIVGRSNMFRDRANASDAMLTDVLTRYIRDVWPEDTPPTVYELVEMLNECGIKTLNGRRWEYANLNQKMRGLGIDRQVIVASRPIVSYATRVADLMQYATTRLADKYAKEARALEPVARDAADIGMPADMPGLTR